VPDDNSCGSDAGHSAFGPLSDTDRSVVHTGTMVVEIERYQPEIPVPTVTVTSQLMAVIDFMVNNCAALFPHGPSAIR